jgi:hypothetical protein
MSFVRFPAVDIEIDSSLTASILFSLPSGEFQTRNHTLEDQLTFGSGLGCAVQSDAQAWVDAVQETAPEGEDYPFVVQVDPGTDELGDIRTRNYHEDVKQSLFYTLYGYSVK